MLACFNCQIYLLSSVECLCFGFLNELVHVIIVSCLKCAFCESNVSFFMLVVFSGYSGLVHNAFC